MIAKTTSTADELIERIKHVGNINPESRDFIVLPDAGKAGTVTFTTDLSLDWELANAIAYYQEEKGQSDDEQNRPKIFCELQEKVRDIVHDLVKKRMA